MDPSVCSVFDSLNDGHGLVVAARILGVGVVVENARPQDGASLFGGHGGPDLGEIGAATFLHIIEVDVKGQDTYPAGAA